MTKIKTHPSPMQERIIVYTTRQAHKIRIAIRDYVPFFCAADVCAVVDLPYTKAVGARFHASECVYVSFGHKPMVTVNKSGLLALLPPKEENIRGRQAIVELIENFASQSQVSKQLTKFLAARINSRMEAYPFSVDENEPEDHEYENGKAAFMALHAAYGQMIMIGCDPMSEEDRSAFKSAQEVLVKASDFIIQQHL